MSSKKPKISRIVKYWFTSIFSLIAGLATIIFAVSAFLGVLDFKQRAVTTVATVIEARYETQNYKMVHKKTSSRPLVEFTDTQGNLQQVQCYIPWRQYDTIKPGETFTIAYLPEDPTDIRLDDNNKLYGSLFLLIAGFVTAIPAIRWIRALIKGKVEELQG